MKNILKRRRRRRRVRFAVFVLLLLSLAIARVAAYSSDLAAQPCSYAEVFVQSGDTLWGIAAANAPEGTDIRKYVKQLEKINGLENAPLRANTMIKLPPLR